MGRALDVLAGLIVGGIVWAFLNVLLSFIPIIGWIFAALIGGYVAGRLGGGAAAVILALFTPILIAVLSGFLISLIPISIIRTIAGGVVGILIALMAIINLIFVGIGGYVGGKEYKSKTCPYCGNKMKAEAVVCTSCGRELKPRTEQVEPPIQQTRPVRPVEVEILPEEPKPSTQQVRPVQPVEAKMLPEGEVKGETAIRQLIVQIEENLTLLDNLKKRLIEGKISEETYKKLLEEFQSKLDKLKERAKEEINKVESEISEVEAERKSEEKLLEELEARMLVGQIGEAEYRKRKIEIKEKIRKIDEKMYKKKLIQKLKELIE